MFVCFLTLASSTRVTVSNGEYACVLMASLGNKSSAALDWSCSFFYKIFWNFMSYEVQIPGKCWPTYTFLAYVWCYCFQILVTPPLMLQECSFYAIKNTRLFVILNSAGRWSLWPGGTTGGFNTTFWKMFFFNEMKLDQLRKQHIHFPGRALAVHLRETARMLGKSLLHDALQMGCKDCSHNTTSVWPLQSDNN